MRILLGHAANCTDVDLIMRANDNVPAPVLEQFNFFIARRLRHEPIAYIMGAKEFWSLSFTVNQHVLIPRPETEGLGGAGLENDCEHQSSKYFGCGYGERSYPYKLTA